MKTKRHPVIRTTLCVLVLAVTIVWAENQAGTSPDPAAAKAPAPQAAVEPEAKDVLMRMAEFLAKTPRFSVNLRANYDVLQESGQMVEFAETLSITLSRPNGLRVEVDQSDGDKQLVLYDGEQITAFSPPQNVYAQASKPGGIDAAVTYFVKDLQMRLPLAVLLVSRCPAELERRTQSLDYVERILMDGKPVHHLAGRTATVDYQFWIAEGPQPLPLRAVLTYKNAEGDPQFRAQFSDWNLAPEIRDAQFAFTPPQGARKIAFVAQEPQVAFKGTRQPEQTGAQK
jgi:hypothetical protein